MKVKVVSNALMNVDRPFLVHAKFFIEKLQEQYPYEYEVSKVDDSYSDEVVNILFYNHDATATADDIVVVTNYRIFSVDKVDDFTSHNFNVRAHSFIDTVREIEYKKIYIEVDTGDTWYNLRSNDDYDQAFVTNNKNVNNRILELRDKLVDARTKVAPESVEDNENSEDYDNGASSVVFVGAKPDNYEYESLVYTQAENINWLSQNGDFLRAMNKIVSQLSGLVGKDECIFNLRYTTQNMGETYSVNAVGDLCKKKQEEKPKE